MNKRECTCPTCLVDEEHSGIYECEYQENIKLRAKVKQLQAAVLELWDLRYPGANVSNVINIVKGIKLCKDK